MRRTRTDLRPVAELLPRLRGAPAADPGLETLRQAWAQAVGEHVARNAEPARLRAGTLVVRCSSAAWASELALLEERLRGSLGEAGVALPERLRFEVGPLPRDAEAAAGAEEPRRPPAEPLRRERDEARAIAGGVREPGLRAALERAVASSLASARTSRGRGAPDGSDGPL